MQNKALRSLGLWGTALVLTPATALVAGYSALAGDRKGKVWWPASRAWAASILNAAGVTEFIVRGDEVIYDAQPVILMANHESQLDPPAMMRSSRRPIGFLAKHELKRIPVFGWAAERTGHVFVDRRSKDRSHASIDTAARRIAEGRCVMVFPEGTRSQTGELLPFKKGGFVLALKAGVPIVPVGIAGTHAIFPPHARLVHETGPVAVVYGQPIAVSDYTLDTKDALIARVREAINDARTTARALVAGRP